MDTKLDLRKAVAELAGTFTFLLIAYMAVLAQAAFSPTASLIVIGFGFGLGLFAAIQIFGAISGGHFNPAVTVAAVLDRRLDPMNGVAYIVAQVIGGIGAALVVMLLFNQAAVKSTVTLPGNGIDDARALVIETIFTAFFVLVILVSTRKAAATAAFAIPLTLLVIHLAIVPFTGTGVNPARSIAPALVGGDLTSLWVYIVGPVIGAVVGWAVYRFTTTDAAVA